MSFRSLSAAVLLLALAGCATAVPPPAPPRPVPVPYRPPPAPAATSGDWRDWPLTLGDWSYRRSGRGSAATFGNSLVLACDLTARRVTLTIVQPPSIVPARLTVRTSSVATALSTGLDDAGQLFVLLEASDPLLDAMGFSRGRFVIEQPGRAPLVIPAWPEILRVAEDCRG